MISKKNLYSTKLLFNLFVKILNKMKQTVNIVGSGFSSLSSACYLAQAGYDVIVFEKNGHLGGRAQVFTQDGFTFDMGPTWYWMPDVFERFFADFNLKPSDFYQLNRLDPAYQVYFDQDDSITIPGSLEEIIEIFEQEEPGSSIHLKRFLNSAKKNYQVAIEDLVYKPGNSPLELITPKTVGLINQVFGNISKDIRKHIKSDRLIKILEFPVLFLGAKPNQTPSLYNFMNWADFGLGTWHPEGGMGKVVDAMVELARSLGVRFETNANVEKILVQDNIAYGLQINGEERLANYVLSGADYHHTEQLLDVHQRQYNEKYWNKKTFAPSSLLLYVGFDKKIEGVSHHTLFFDTDFDVHANSIYDTIEWPEEPMFYASFASKTDTSLAPDGKEAATFLIPIAPGLTDTEEMRKHYLEMIIQRMERLLKTPIREHILFSKSYCVNDFISDYNSFKGNAYGLANTLKQTAFMRPKIKSKKVDHLYFTGQLTVPGPGVPPALISGKIASQQIVNHII